MIGFLLAVAALLCFLLELFGATVNVDLIVLGWVFIAAYLVVNSGPVASRVP